MMRRWTQGSAISLPMREFRRHRHSSETVVIELAPDSDCVALNIPIGQWHTVRVLESGTVILECKDGKFEPLGPEDILSNPA